jgi:3-keto-L-gulonate-6-phosphate decarboxylase
VEAVYISPAMFRMIGKIPDVEFKDGEIDFSPIIKSMSGFYVLEASDAKVAADLYAEVKKFIDKGQYELLIETKENGEVTRIYSYGDEKTVSSLIMITQEQGETMYVSIDGKMDREELENLLAQAAAE